ncbi:hypothetical protein K443DRAFT_11992 [Laccaria amethystina LaAM-08-1]|uniref:Uncharacterized protein n=1 Tax=Laccaria amethystina LaAM-08-1 TaxID=1095629 RepID=A0A0C9XA96_9AGAR|nr:hypothetical protein K443DRAFT_11992 [Laccaria amethystina LaAM-08-1]
MSLHGETHSSGFPRPPITPYDVLFLVTTIVFGIAKAVTASLGATIVPTTLEWVLRDRVSQRFPNNLRKPTLDPANEPPASETKDTPIVTGNRIFVTISVVGFGVSKAIVTYRGLPTSANTLDWVFAIVFSSLTYCLEMYQDDAAYAWPSVFQSDYQPSLYSGTTFLGITLMFSIGLLITSFWTITIGYSYVFLWNWVPEKPSTKLLLLPSLDYIHLISCKILLGCFTTIALAVAPSMMSAFSIFVTFDPMRNFLRIIWRSVLVCVASTSRFFNAILITVAIWGSVLNLFRPLGQAASSALIRVGFIPLFQIVAEYVSEIMFAQRIFRLFKRIGFLPGFVLVLSFVLAIVAPIAPIGLWIPTTALHDSAELPQILRLFVTFGLISTSIISGVIFVGILYSTEQPNAS